MSEAELKQLAKLLGMTTINIEYITKILEYANKLDISDDLNKYPIKSILDMKNLLGRINYREIIRYCSNSNN